MRGIPIIFFLLLISGSCCYSADILFIRAAQSSSAAREELEMASNFYGVNLKTITISPDSELELNKAADRQGSVGVVIAADGLAAVNKKTLLRALNQVGNRVPLFILGVTPETNPSLLKALSGGAISGCRRLDGVLPLQYTFGGVEGLTGQLTGLEIPLQSKEVFYLLTAENSAPQRIIGVRSSQSDFPVFIEAMVQQRKVFVACSASADASSPDGEGRVTSFLRIAPTMMFVRYSAGESGWHALHHYANLTIDDPWLRQPYGYVDYMGLLEQMERHRFHTTIAFIPWNYDRSDPQVVSLFRKHPDRFSIAIHGDNHDHKEFTDYKSKPLPMQIVDVKQSLARMEKFQTLTGIGYDRVMIFPHSIPPEKTLEQLKIYNFLATINSNNVPQGDTVPSSPSFILRPVTLLFSGFPSIARYSIAVPVTQTFIAVNKYLDDPLFFYGHSDDFAKSIGAFNGVVDEINKIEADTQWRSVGDIVRHLYLVKLREDSNYDVLAFSNNVCLDNVVGRNATFYVRRQVSSTPAIKSVTVDGEPYSYKLEDGYFNASVPVASGGSRCVAIEYENDLHLASIIISKNSFIPYVLREASDFRDIYLAKSATGMTFINFYYDHELTPKQLLGIALILMPICMYAAYRLWAFAKAKRQSRTA
jgi:hypothetical protein